MVSHLFKLIFEIIKILETTKQEIRQKKLSFSFCSNTNKDLISTSIESHAILFFFFWENKNKERERYQIDSNPLHKPIHWLPHHLIELMNYSTNSSWIPPPTNF